MGTVYRILGPGGSGKSTLATALGVHFALEGKKTIILSTDLWDATFDFLLGAAIPKNLKIWQADSEALWEPLLKNSPVALQIVKNFARSKEVILTHTVSLLSEEYEVVLLDGIELDPPARLEKLQEGLRWLQSHLFQGLIGRFVLSWFGKTLIGEINELITLFLKQEWRTLPVEPVFISLQAFEKEMHRVILPGPISAKNLQEIARKALE